MIMHGVQLSAAADDPNQHFFKWMGLGHTIVRLGGKKRMKGHLQKIRKCTPIDELVDGKPGGRIDLGDAAVFHESVDVDVDLGKEIQEFVVIGRVRVVIGQC